MTLLRPLRAVPLAAVAAVLVLAAPLPTADAVPHSSSAWNGPPLTRLAWGKAPAIVFAPAGQRSGVYLIAPKGGSPTRITNYGADGGLSLSPNGKLLLVDGFNTVREMRTFTIAGRYGDEDLEAGWLPVWSPDGKRFLFVTTDDITATAVGGSSQVIVRTRDITEPPAWSPDGTKIAYVGCSPASVGLSCEPNTGNVYVIGVDGSGQHSVTPTPGSPRCPAWSSIGRLAFIGSDGAVTIVRRTGVARLAAAGCPVWSPNGRDLASPTATGVTLFDADGAQPRQLTILPGSHTVFTAVAWSGDGKSLAVAGGPAGKNLWVVRADGSAVTKLL